jgi:hypothetical protein
MSICGQSAGGILLQMTDLLTTVTSAPSAFLKPKCALWDCPRTAIGSESWHDYCSMYHVDLAVQEEGAPGKITVIRPRGINLLFVSVQKSKEKCWGSQSMKELLLQSFRGMPLVRFSFMTCAYTWYYYCSTFRSLHLWRWIYDRMVFFDKPRRAFDSGNREQWSLLDYNSRGWHESRKQVMNFGVLKRSYYMDPQPSNSYECYMDPRSHRIFRPIHEALNIGKKIINCSVCL